MFTVIEINQRKYSSLKSYYMYKDTLLINCFILFTHARQRYRYPKPTIWLSKNSSNLSFSLFAFVNFVVLLQYFLLQIWGWSCCPSALPLVRTPLNGPRQDLRWKILYLIFYVSNNLFVYFEWFIKISMLESRIYLFPVFSLLNNL